MNTRFLIAQRSLGAVLMLLMCARCAGGEISDTVASPASAPATGTTQQAPSVSPAAESSTEDNAGVVDPAPHTLGPGANPPLVALKTEIEAAAQATGVPASLMGSLIWQESRADAQVAGGGLTQMGANEFTDIQTRHPDVVGTLQDPGANIMAGAYYLSELRDTMTKRYGRTDWPTALRAYNSGPNGVDPNDLNATPAGTGDPLYITRLTKFWQIIASGTGTLPP